MNCVDCGKKKDIEKVNVIIYKRNICNDCVDDDLNMKLAEETKERFEQL